MTLNEKEKKYLLDLARKAVKQYLGKGTKLDIKPQEVISKRLIEDGACFVTLYMHKNNKDKDEEQGQEQELRGCIGSLEAHKPLVLDVVDNALNAAFSDPRFYPLRLEELPLVRFAISVLTKPEPFPVNDANDLLQKLIPNKHGLILRKGYAQATFLPVVWEQLPTKEEFLSHLCVKAGLEPDEWRNTRGMQFLVYEAEEFEE